MTVTALIPQIFYADLDVGIRLFRDALGFAVVYRDDDEANPFCILRRDAVKVHLCRNDELARGDRPQLRLATDDIHGLHRDVLERAPQLIHPNGKTVTLKPWGLWEFAVLDETHVCVIVEQGADAPSPP